MRTHVAFLLALALSTPGRAQQVGVPDYKPNILNPVFAFSQGPLVLIDQAHNNFHTGSGRFLPFANVLRADGFRVDSLTNPLSMASLDRADILVIANALHPSNLGNWVLPTPSAFTDSEIDALADWVSAGGSLFLIADHMPFPGAAAELAARFGFYFNNGFALHESGRGIFSFTNTSQNLLADHSITSGRMESERIDSVVTFAGHGFRADSLAQPILIFGPDYHTLMPERAWQFDNETPSEPLDGWLQGAVKTHGAGRIAVFGEAATFSAQESGGALYGMNSPAAPQNEQFLRNVMMWLSGNLE